eukprot:14565568-Alexandrium_andersonii.AAC.2
MPARDRQAIGEPVDTCRMCIGAFPANLWSAFGKLQANNRNADGRHESEIAGAPPVARQEVTKLSMDPWRHLCATSVSDW